MADHQPFSLTSPDGWPPSPADGWPPSPSFTLSSNPPNPKTSFRAGDWICAEAHCSAHNFGRNSICIGCGRQRHPTAMTAASDHFHIVPPPSYHAPPMARLSPRFAASASALRPGFSTPSLYTELARAGAGLHTQSSPGALAPPMPMPLAPGMPSATQSMGPRSNHPYPLLTPSGRAISVGGRVQNVSNDPLAPCIVYWPDNEPPPEQGQIRPSGSTVITYPPIINTGNKGAAEKQPGDWVCQKCNYLNWRRRKVCQTCFPYAEGNGDSISAAVQAERIALLENVLATQVEQTHMRTPGPDAHPPPRPPAHLLAHGTHSPASPFPADSPLPPWADFAPARFPAPAPMPPIYHTQAPSEGRAVKTGGGSLLPGFLAEIVHSDSPSLSPSTSTSSAETDEYDELRRAAHFTYDARTPTTTNPLTIHEHSIWKLDGAELHLGGARPRARKPTVPRDLAHGLGGAGAGTGVQGLAAAVAALTITPGPAAGRR